MGASPHAQGGVLTPAPSLGESSWEAAQPCSLVTPLSPSRPRAGAWNGHWTEGPVEGAQACQGPQQGPESSDWAVGAKVCVGQGWSHRPPGTGS